MEVIVGVITALGGAATAVLGGLAMLVKARSIASVQMNVLRRLWALIASKGLVPQMPDGLRKDTRRLLGRPDTNADEQGQEATE